MECVLGNGFFIQNLFGSPQDQFYFLAVVVVVVISIVLHELGHGWMALRLGDPTPRVQGRMTGNPLVHMGPFSLLALVMVGFAWGSMPIDPSRMRGKYAGAKVAAAGPAVNLILGVLASLVHTVTLVLGYPDSSVQWQENLCDFLFYMAVTNFLLMLFNLLPVPPLDGSHILADFHRGYARALGDPGMHGIWMLSFFGAFMITGALLSTVATQMFGQLTIASLWVMELIGLF